MRVVALSGESTSFEELLLNSIEESIMNLSESCRSLLYKYLAGALSLKKDQIPKRLEDFNMAIKEIFKLGTKVIDGLFLKTLCEKLNVDYVLIKSIDLQTTIEEIKRRSRT
jgi:ribulose kinase